MKHALLIMALGAALTGCEKQNDIFGASYDECVLKNLKQGAVGTRANILESCQRHFERPPASAHALPVDGTMTRDRSHVTFEFRVSNNRSDVIVTGFTITATFYDEKVSNEDFLAQYQWSYRENLAPMSNTTTYGKLTGDELAQVNKFYGDKGRNNPFDQFDPPAPTNEPASGTVAADGPPPTLPFEDAVSRPKPVFTLSATPDLEMASRDR